MKILLKKINLKSQYSCDNLVVAVLKQPAEQKNVLKNHFILGKLDEVSQKYLADYIKSGNFNQEFQEIKSVFLPQNGNIKKIILLGLGEKEKLNLRKIILAVRRLVMFLKENKINGASLILDDFARVKESPEIVLKSIIENIKMADYEFNIYKEKPKEGWPKIEQIEILASDKEDFKVLNKALSIGEIIGEWVNKCRQLANTPGSDMTPNSFVKMAKSFVSGFNSAKLVMEVLDKKKMEQLKMGAILGVAKGSQEEPKFLIVKYENGGKNKPIVFVGKGLTFDSGGLNLKPEAGMNEMHMDMSGGAAVFCATAVAAQLRLPVNLICLVPLVENMLSGSSYRPGDVLKTMSGKTIEVLNTDAEGRIVLADALLYAKKFNPKMVIDVATLTGACHVALGNHAIGLFTKDLEVENLVRKLGESSGDYVWPLPLWEEYENEVKGCFGDVANVGKYGRVGGAITAAAFLYQFIKDADCQWVHLDIASTMAVGPSQVRDHNLAVGASGTGVRLLVEYLRNRL